MPTPTRTADGNCATTPGPPQIAATDGSGTGSWPAPNPGPTSAGASRNGRSWSAAVAGSRSDMSGTADGVALGRADAPAAAGVVGEGVVGAGPGAAADCPLTAVLHAVAAR